MPAAFGGMKARARGRMQTLSPAPNERTIQGKLMRKVTIGVLVLGVVVLIAWNWLWLWAPEWLFDLLSQQTASPVAAVLSMREWVQIIISVVLLIASLFVVLSPKYGPKDKHWAYGTIGTLVGFWLRQ